MGDVAGLAEYLTGESFESGPVAPHCAAELSSENRRSYYAAVVGAERERTVMARSRGRGELEDAVLTVLHAAAAPRTAGEVREDLARGIDEELAYTTVLTILVRLHQKGIVERERRGRAYAYRPVSDEAGLAARRMREVLDERADRDTVLARFVGDLSDEDEKALRRLLGD